MFRFGWLKIILTSFFELQDPRRTPTTRFWFPIFPIRLKWSTTERRTNGWTTTDVGWGGTDAELVGVGGVLDSALVDIFEDEMSFSSFNNFLNENGQNVLWKFNFCLSRWWFAIKLLNQGKLTSQIFDQGLNLYHRALIIT